MLYQFLKKIRFYNKYLLFIFPGFGFVCFSAFAQEDITQSRNVTLQVSDKIASYGEFYPGEKNKPAILILHGFMLTHNFQTVKRLAEALHDSGYTILTPTLSLGINKRKMSLSCEAIHTHSLNNDINEINQWVKWLNLKTGKKIILVGHSAGSSQIIAYAHHYPDAPIKQLIFLSMPNFGDAPNSFATRKDVELAKNTPDKNELKTFALSYCSKYVTTAKYFMSYYKLSKDNLYQYLKQSPINKTLILGSKDTRVDKKWNKSLASAKIRIIIIEDANHFFDDEYEFDLLDTPLCQHTCRLKNLVLGDKNGIYPGI